MKITRVEWEKICESILQKTVTLTNKALEDARISAKDISMVILAGGATHAPNVTELLKGMFPGK
jgi:molecular chaperone DnaK